MIRIISITIISIQILFVINNDICPSGTQKLPKYYLIEKCYRSKLGIIAKANFSSLNSCQRLAIEKKGLSFNFSPPEVRANIEYTCEVLRCAEASGGQALVNDTAFDYYSIYGKPIPHINSTCVPAIGMFHLLTSRMNFTDALSQCKNISGVLCNVTSEQRTDLLAQLLAGAGVDAAYTGLRRMNSSVFIDQNEATLDCITFRAWAPGHPRRNYTKYDCVLLTRKKTWLTTSCSKPYPALCELIPGGPYRRGRIFKSSRRLK